MCPPVLYVESKRSPSDEGSLCTQTCSVPQRRQFLPRPPKVTASVLKERTRVYFVKVVLVGTTGVRWSHDCNDRAYLRPVVSKTLFSIQQSPFSQTVSFKDLDNTTDVIRKMGRTSHSFVNSKLLDSGPKQGRGYVWRLRDLALRTGGDWWQGDWVFVSSLSTRFV